MQSLNEEVIKAREIVAGYKLHNEKTVETVKEYDPKMKIWYFAKKEIDPKAKEYAEKITKVAKKEKMVNTKIPSPKKKRGPKPKPKPKMVAPKKEERLKVAKVKATKHQDFDQNTLKSQAYNYYLAGKSYDEISKLLDRNKRSVISMIGARNRQLGIIPEKSDSYEKVVELIKKGKTTKEIASILKMRSPVVSYHFNRYNNAKSPEEKEADKLELLELIKKNSNLNEGGYCYSSWISSHRCKMKANLSSTLRNRLCDDLIKEGRLVENLEGKNRVYGRMYLIPKK